jgi:hypothetical protein
MQQLNQYPVKLESKKRIPRQINQMGLSPQQMNQIGLSPHQMNQPETSPEQMNKIDESPQQPHIMEHFSHQNTSHIPEQMNEYASKQPSQIMSNSIQSDVIKNDRLFDSVNNMPKYKMQESPLPNINYNNSINVRETDPIQLTRPVESDQPREMSYDELEKLRNQQDQDIKNGLDNPSSVDIRKTTEYNNKKDHKNDINIQNIRDEVAGERQMQELETGNLADDSLSFSFL